MSACAYDSEDDLDDDSLSNSPAPHPGVELSRRSEARPSQPAVSAIPKARPSSGERSLAQSLTHNMLNLTSMTSVSGLSLSANTSPRGGFFSRVSSSEVDEVEDELLRNVHHRVTCPKNQGQITSPERKAASRAINSHSLGGHAPSDGLGAGGGGGGGGGGGEAGNASILSAASPFAAPLSFINQVSKLFQQPPPQAGTAERPAAPASSSGRGLRASLASHELKLHRASASAKCTSAVSSAAPAAAGSSLSADAVAWEEYENLKSVRLLRATRKDAKAQIQSILSMLQEEIETEESPVRPLSLGSRRTEDNKENMSRATSSRGATQQPRSTKLRPARPSSVSSPLIGKPLKGCTESNTFQAQRGVLEDLSNWC
eukprot:Tamp_10560.p1 GENE.Tamp_10560~~Tamp_10560.p1  ORF type:complete len:373 (+),score=41.56 Tamp_10560:1-1119(+)